MQTWSYYLVPSLCTDKQDSRACLDDRAIVGTVKASGQYFSLGMGRTSYQTPRLLVIIDLDVLVQPVEIVLLAP